MLDGDAVFVPDDVPRRGVLALWGTGSGSGKVELVFAGGRNGVRKRRVSANLVPVAEAPTVTAGGEDAWRAGPLDPADLAWLNELAASFPAAAHALAVRADRALGTSAFARLADRCGISQRELARGGLAWRYGGSRGLELLHTEWEPAGPPQPDPAHVAETL